MRHVLITMFEHQAATAHEVAKTAIDQGTYSGDALCFKTWETLLASAPDLATWPKVCGGRAQ